MSAKTTVKQLAESICRDPELAVNWPPNVFAVSAYILDLTGGYVLATEFGSGKGGNRWHNECSKISGKWSLGDSIQNCVAPIEVQQWWRVVFSFNESLSSLDMVCLSEHWRDLLVCLIKLLCVSDSTSAGFGISSEYPDRGLGHASKILIDNMNKSLCSDNIDSTRVCVLPKQHTPQCGLTLRSLSHHLAFLRNRGIRALWFSPIQIGNGDKLKNRLDGDVINILLCPWPLSIDGRDFSLVSSAPNHHMDSSSAHRFFKYEPKISCIEEFKNRFQSVVDRALELCSTLHIAVFPELYLSRAELDIAKSISAEHGLILLAGVREPVGDGLARNTAVVDLQPYFKKHHSSSNDNEIDKILGYLDSNDDFAQDKHHRWTLDQRQILRYDLGSFLPVCRQVWEWTPIQERRINFFSIEDWLTWTSLICEDLARQDPVAELIRSVGPNLLIALLMDGPQLVSRWPARYASILADDPGTSVLTLTCLGMINRSCKDDNGKRLEPVRSIALWSDAFGGTREILIEENAVAALLSVSRREREEWSADGRSDNGISSVPVYVGHHSIKI